MKTITLLIFLCIVLYGQKDLQDASRGRPYQVTNLEELRKDLPQDFGNGIVWVRVWQKGKVLCFEYQMKENHLGETQLQDWKAVVRGLIIGELELEYKNSSKEDPESVRSHFDKGLDYQYIYHSPNHKEQIKFKITRRDLLG